MTSRYSHVNDLLNRMQSKRWARDGVRTRHEVPQRKAEVPPLFYVRQHLNLAHEEVLAVLQEGGVVSSEIFKEAIWPNGGGMATCLVF